MQLKADLQQLEQHLELLDDEDVVCRRLKLELEQCRAQESLEDRILFWEQQLRFLREERNRISKRRIVLLQALEELRCANVRMREVIEEAKRPLVMVE